MFLELLWCTSAMYLSLPWDVVQQAAKTYSGYQGLLGLQADEFANLTAAEKEAEGRYAVWKTLLELQEKVIDWTTGPLLNRQDNSVSPWLLSNGRIILASPKLQKPCVCLLCGFAFTIYKGVALACD